MVGASEGGAGSVAGGKRIEYIAWVRAIGCVAIVLLHALLSTRRDFGADELGILRYQVDLWLDVFLTRWGVPVFLMVSGALLLDPEREVGDEKLRRYAGRMLGVLLVVGLPLGIVKVAMGGGSEPPLAILAEAVVNLLSGSTWDHLWYLYAMVGLYLLTPMARAYVADASRGQLRGLLAALFVLTMVVPTINAVFSLGLTQFYVTLPAAFTYFLLGHYAHTYLRAESRIVVAGVLCAVLSASLCVWQSTASVGSVSATYLPESPLVCATSLAVFLSLRGLLDSVPISSHSVWSTLSRHSFGIYVLHPIFLHLFILFVPLSALPAGLYELSVALFSLVGALAGTWVLRRLPLVGRWFA